MDVSHLDFLARQPSAALSKREHFWGIPKRGLAIILANALFWQPLLAQADGIVVSGSGTSVGQSANGVPVINIAAPNGSGLSHNQFHDYNVGSQGIILNNSTQDLQNTQLGGHIFGNSGLNGRAATVILNEVNGGNPSQLRGYTEVAGQSAHVIVANPYGISCNGCGFINTPQATLTTGKPVIENGQLTRYQVDQGSISIDGGGLNVNNIDRFEIITRSAKINAEIQARNLTIVAGANDVDARSLNATARAANPVDAPQLAIDSSALGGMYAGAIRLVGTEAGVGVKLHGDMVASGGDIHIDANGQLSLARTAASTDVILVAERIELNADTYAGRNAEVRAEQVEVRESLAAGSHLQVDSNHLSNTGILEAGVHADGSFNPAAHLQLNGGQIDNSGSMTSHGTLTADVRNLNNQAGKLTAAGDAKLKADTLNNEGGQVLAQRDLNIQVGTSDNRGGKLLAGRALTVSGTDLNNQGGTVAATAAIKTELSGTLNNTSGLVEAGTLLDLGADTLSNANGQLRALGASGTSRFAIGGRFDNDNGKVEIGNAKLSLSATRFDQARGGRLLVLGELDADGVDWRNDGEIDTQASRVSLSGSYQGNGRLISEQDLVLNATSLTIGNEAQVRAGGKAELTLDGELRSSGVITATQSLKLVADKVHNLGTLGSAGAVRIEAQELQNENGLLFSGADMQLRGKSLTNRFGDIYSFGSLDFALDDQYARAEWLENISGTIESADDMRLSVNSLINRKHKLVFDRRLVSGNIRVTGTDNCKGDHCEAAYAVSETYAPHITEDSASANLMAGGDLRFNGATFDNRFSTVSAGHDISIDTEQFFNTGAGGGELHSSSYYIYTKSDSAYWNFISNLGSYNAYNDPASATYNPGALPFSSIALGSQTGGSVTAVAGSVVAPAIVQAGGKVDILGRKTLENSVIREDEVILPGGGRSGDTQIGTAPSPTLNPQLPPDLAQQTVDPLALPSFNLPEGQNGLFSLSLNPDHPYLIETNPAFASLGGFLNSDYLFGMLGYDVDTVQRRLGDGLYEQRLIQQAVVARTGKRLLDGLASDEAQYKYLMDNAIASKDTLNLVPGIALTSEQVAALTHDIVWMQEQEVNGQKVLVPVLYLAQANDRLAPNGALIQGRDVALITGGELKNSGTLRASVNLGASAKNITNSGLMQANERLQLLATDSIRNTQGGIVNGKDVSLLAKDGDITNERSIGTSTGRDGGFSWSQSVADNAARIEASNDLALAAGRDLRNIGGVLQASGDAQLLAGRDLVIGSATEVDSTQARFKKYQSTSQTITQHGSEVKVGGNLIANASGDLMVVGSRVQAGGDAGLSADGNVTIVSAANESSSQFNRKSSGKKVHAEEQRITQQSSVIEAGGSLEVMADGNLILSASHLKAGGEAYLYAGEQLALLAAQDSDYSLYDMKKKGGWGSKETQRDEVTKVRNIGSSITTGGDLILVSEGDQTYQRALLESGKDLILDSGGSITFEAVKDLDQESHENSKGDLAWNSASGKGRTDETLRQSTLEHQGQLTIKAADGLHIDLKQIDQKSVSETIDIMVKADPSLAWLKEAEARGDVDWRKVQEVHDSFKYSHSGLGAGAVLAIMIVVAAITAGAASAALGSVAGATAGSGTAMAAAGTSAAGAATAAGWANVALTAVATSAAGGAAVSTINNKGNLGAVIKDVTSSDALKGYVISGVTAGMTAAYFNDWTGTATDPATGKITTNLSTWKGIGQFAASQGLQNGTSAAMSKIMGQSGDLGDVLQSTLFNTLAAASFHAVGDYVPSADGSLQKVMVHAMVGGLLAQVSGGDFITGALAAGANEALVAQLNTLVQGDPNLLSMSSQLVGLLAAATLSDADGDSLKTGAWVAQNGTQYNFGDHLPPGLTEYGQAATSLVEYMQSQGASVEEIDQVTRALAQGQGFEGVQPANEFVKAWGEFMAGQLSGLGLAAALGKAGSWFAKETSKVIAQYGPMNQGPLPKGIADTFRSGTYSEVVTQQPTTLYRVYGGTAQELGGYWTATKPAGPVQSIIDSALNPQWGNTATKVVKIEVPIGTKYFEGVAAPQGGLVGGGNQVLFPKGFKIDTSWIRQ